jgi:hypothetical protein
LPWAKNTYERTVKVYKDFLYDVLINHHQDIEMTAKELLIRGEILKHDFTKRQMVIIMFIMTFSYNYGKETAYIPKLKDFAIAGISERKIKNEIDKLLKMNVIEWNKDECLFSFKEPRFWNAPYNVGYNDNRSQELFLMNLDHAGIDVSLIIEKLKKMNN